MWKGFSLFNSLDQPSPNCRPPCRFKVISGMDGASSSTWGPPWSTAGCPQPLCHLPCMLGNAGRKPGGAADPGAAGWHKGWEWSAALQKARSAEQ